MVHGLIAGWLGFLVGWWLGVVKSDDNADLLVILAALTAVFFVAFGVVSAWNW